MRTELRAAAASILLLLPAIATAQEAPPAEPPLRTYPQRRAKRDAEPRAVAAVDDALTWLAAHQAPDGRWSAAGWGARCREGARCEGPGFDRGVERFDVHITGLALMAFLGQGHAPGAGPHGDVVARGLAWLRGVQGDRAALIGYDPDLPPLEGVLEGTPGFEPIPLLGQPEPPPAAANADPFQGTTYNHPPAAIALCEAYALTGEAELRLAAVRAVEATVAAQNPGLGWKHGVRPGRNDSSMTGWMAQVLRAAEDAGLPVPEAAWNGAERWFERATDSEGRVGWETPGGEERRLYADPQRVYWSSWAPPVETALHALFRGFRRDSQSRMKKRKLEAWFKDATFEARREGDRPVVPYLFAFVSNHAVVQYGGKEADRWNAAVTEVLVSCQRRDGCARGSWDGVEMWAVLGGRVYATATAALALEAPYRLPRYSTQRR